MAFCVHCGVDGALAFCHSCGQPQPGTSQSGLLHASMSRTSASGADSNDRACDGPTVVALAGSRGYRSISNDSSPDRRQSHGVSTDWAGRLDYQLVIQQPAVRAMLQRAASVAKRSIDSRDILALIDAISTIPVSVGSLTDALVPIVDKLGIRTARSSAGSFRAPAGRILAAALCAQVELGCVLEKVRQEPERCALVARIPRNLFIWQGQLTTMIERRAEDCLVQVSAVIAGQWYDWGKSNQLIQLTLSKIADNLACPQAAAS